MPKGLAFLYIPFSVLHGRVGEQRATRRLRIGRLSDDFDTAGPVEQPAQTFQGERLVIDQEGAQRRRLAHAASVVTGSASVTTAPPAGARSSVSVPPEPQVSV